MNKAFKAIVGSINYNLADEQSDVDYKTFYFPTFDDLYEGDKKSKVSTSKEEDNEYHDIRKLPDMLWKSNINFIEVLFSKEVDEYDSSLYKELYDMREEIASMNLPYLWDACYGMIHQKLKSADRSMNYIDINESNEERKGRIGKDLHHVFRLIYFLISYAENDFHNFSDAIYVEDVELLNRITETKRGKIDLCDCYEEFSAIIKTPELEGVKEIYKSMSRDESINKRVRDIVEKHVKYHIRKELNK